MESRIVARGVMPNKGNGKGGLQPPASGTHKFLSLRLREEDAVRRTLIIQRTGYKGSKEDRYHGAGYCGYLEECHLSGIVGSNNFARHGKGNLLDLALSKSNNVIALTIQDNGQGFDVENVQKGVGLESMRERV